MRYAHSWRKSPVTSTVDRMGAPALSRDLNPADEPPIDTSLAHYLEERALAIAGEKARTEEERAAVSRLLAFRQSLMTDREAFSEESVRKRHARGEIYSPARVAVINSYCPSRESLTMR